MKETLMTEVEHKIKWPKLFYEDIHPKRFNIFKWLRRK